MRNIPGVYDTMAIWLFLKLADPFCGCPSKKSRIIWGAVLGPLDFWKPKSCAESGLRKGELMFLEGG